MRSIHALTSSAIRPEPITVTWVDLTHGPGCRRAADDLISTLGLTAHTRCSIALRAMTLLEILQRVPAAEFLRRGPPVPTWQQPIAMHSDSEVASNERLRYVRQSR